MTRTERLVFLAVPVAALAIVAGAVAQQTHGIAMPDATTITVTAESGTPEVPFEVINNHLILPISVNGSEPLSVVLDTGMPASGIALHSGPYLEALALDIDPSVQVHVAGAGGSGARYAARVAAEESLALPGLAIDRTRVIVMPKLLDFAGYHQGIIGYTLFERFVVELDYDGKVMRLHEPASYRAPADAHVVPITFKQKVPYVPVRITPIGGEPYDATVVIDLGASHAISLNSDTESVDRPAETLTTILGRGVSGVVKGEVGRIATLELAGARLDNVVASFPVSEHQNPRGVDSLEGNLGSDVLRRFHTTFDYSRGQLILVPNRSFAEPFAFDRSGVRLGMGREPFVEYVIAGSPAEKAGIEIGDVLRKLDGRAVSGEDYGKIKGALMGSGEVRLSLRRGDRELEKTIVLRQLI